MSTANCFKLQETFVLMLARISRHIFMHSTQNSLVWKRTQPSLKAFSNMAFTKRLAFEQWLSTFSYFRITSCLTSSLLNVFRGKFKQFKGILVIRDFSLLVSMFLSTIWFELSKILNMGFYWKCNAIKFKHLLRLEKPKNILNFFCCSRCVLLEWLNCIALYSHLTNQTQTLQLQLNRQDSIHIFFSCMQSFFDLSFL